MAIATNAQKETLAVAYGAAALYGALYTTAPSGGAAGTEVTGGSPAYARKALSWTAGGSDGIVTVTVTFDIPAGVTIAGFGVHSALTGGTFLDGAALSPTQAFATQGQYVFTYTFTQS